MELTRSDTCSYQGSLQAPDVADLCPDLSRTARLAPIMQAPVIAARAALQRLIPERSNGSGAEAGPSLLVPIYSS